jgi:hypothetical protein
MTKSYEGKQKTPMIKLASLKLQIYFQQLIELMGISDAYTLKRPLSSSSFMFSPKFPMNRVLHGGLSFAFCGKNKKIKK